MPKPYYQDGAVTIYHGDCREVLPSVRVEAIVTSPPYGMQRADQYGGVSEDAYPGWTVEWMEQARRALHVKGSALINVREPQRDGEISAYVHLTRLALRSQGWSEIDELIWVKPDGMPVGAVNRPRRSWERVLWFSPTSDPNCYPKNNGQWSTRLGLAGSGRASQGWVSGESGKLASGLTRCQDWVSVSVRSRPNWIDHPAVYPDPLAKWLIRLITNELDTVCDPFMGSGTTLRAAKDLGRKAIGIEIEERYCEIAAKRCAQEVLF